MDEMVMNGHEPFRVKVGRSVERHPTYRQSIEIQEQRRQYAITDAAEYQYRTSLEWLHDASTRTAR